jgi:hypothetical protein
MSSSLFFDNKRYISIKEAGSVTGYSRDYIGQLARSNKIDSKRVGRTWYVEKESLLKYGNFKKYVSAKEAGSVTGYSRDYIGQLARSNKIDSKRVGRTWYVEEESLLSYKNLLNKLGLPSEPRHEADNTSKKISDQEIPSVKKYQLFETPRGSKRKVLPTGMKLSLFASGFLLLVGIFYLSDINFPDVLKNISSISTSFLPADLIKSLTKPNPAVYTIDSLAEAYKNYVSPTSTINISDLADAYKNYVSPSSIPPVSIVKKNSPVISATPSLAALTSAIEKVINTPSITAKLRGPVGSQGIQGIQGNPGLSSSSGAPAAIPVEYIPVGTNQPNPSANFSGASIFNANDLSSGNFTTNNANITDLTVSSSSTVAGNLSVAGDSVFLGNLGIAGIITSPGAITLGTGANNTNTIGSGASSVNTIGSATTPGTLTLHGATTLDNTFSQTGANTFDTGTGAVSLNGITTVTGANTFISTGQAVFTRVPTLAHAFTTWPAGVSNVADSTVYINPASSVSNGNLIGAAVNGIAKFIVDSEGNIYANNLVFSGSVSSGSNTMASLSVLDNTILGDAGTDTVTINANPVNLAGSSPVLDATNGSATLSINTTTNRPVTFGTGLVTIPNLVVTNSQSSNGTMSIDSSATTQTIFTITGASLTSGTGIAENITAHADSGAVTKVHNLAITDATTAGGGFTGIGISVTGTGNGSGAKYLLDLNPNTTNNEIVFDNLGAFRPTTAVASNTATIGNSNFYWKNGYFDQITANSVAGVVTGGATSSTGWTIGSTQTGDVPESLTFYRANIGQGNATIKWDAGASDLRYFSANYPINATYTVSDTSIGTDINLLSGNLTNNTSGGTQKLLSLTNTGTGTTENGIYLYNNGAGAITGLEIAGTWTNGIITNNNSINAGTGAISSGALTATTVNGLTITANGTNTLNIAAGKTLTVSDSATLAANAITLAGGEVVTFSPTNALSLLTTAGTSVTLPTSGTLVSSVTTDNGVSAVNTAGALAFSLGAITPSSVNSIVLSGSATPTLAVTGTSSISGSNTGDQTLSGLGGQTQLNGTGFVKASGTSITYDNSTYLTSLSGAAILAGISGGQTLNGGTLTTNLLTLRANAADLTSGYVHFLDTTTASNATTAGVVMDGGLAVAKKIYSTDLQVTNTITGSVSGNAGTVTGLSVTAGQTLTVTTGGTLGSNAYTSTAYLPTASFTDAAVTGKLITGFVSGAGTVAATDTILQAINKLDGNVAGKAAVGQTMYIGTTGVAINRASNTLALAGVSIDGNAGTVTNGVYTNGSYSDPSWLTALNATKLTTGTGNVTIAALASNGVITLTSGVSGYVTINSGGGVGIGRNPTSDLDVYNAASYVRLTLASGYSDVDIKTAPLSSSYATYFDNWTVGSKIVFRTSNASSVDTSAMTILANGNVRMAAYGAGAATFDASGNITSASDERLKDIQGNYTAGLSDILNINPIIYKWNQASGMETEHTYAGFSAQNVQASLPLSTGQDSQGYLSLQDRAIEAATVNAIKELNLNLDAVAGTETPPPGSASETFMAAFFNNIKTTIGAWLADAGNGLANIFAKQVTADTLCVSDASGAKTCINKAQLDTLLANAAGSVANNTGSNSTSGNTGAGTPTCTPPQTLVNNVCTDPTPPPAPIVPTCTAPQTLVNNVCTDPAPIVPTCVSPQTLVNNVCTDPTPTPPPADSAPTP